MKLNIVLVVPSKLWTNAPPTDLTRAIFVNMVTELHLMANVSVSIDYVYLGIAIMWLHGVMRVEITLSTNFSCKYFVCA